MSNVFVPARGKGTIHSGDTIWLELDGQLVQIHVMSVDRKAGRVMLENEKIISSLLFADGEWNTEYVAEKRATRKAAPANEATTQNDEAFDANENIAFETVSEDNDEDEDDDDIVYESVQGEENLTSSAGESLRNASRAQGQNGETKNL